jgi:GT2 family glycosyltransferase
MNKEKNKQFIYRNINRGLVNCYCRSNHKIQLKNPPRLVSVIMLSFNRVEDTILSLKALYRYTKVPFEVILLDNNSDSDQLSLLKENIKKYKNIRLIESNENLGCAKGRVEATKEARGEYYLFLDNDIVVTPYYLENLIKTLEKDEKIIAACCKVIFPDLTIQFNGGTLKGDGDFLIYNLLDSFKLFWESETTEKSQKCPWIPGGATLWKSKYYKKYPIDEQMQGSFEDNEVSLRINKGGHKLSNCPKSIAIHYHVNFKDIQFKSREKRYMSGRYNEERTMKALRHFWKVHGKAFVFDNEEATYGFLGDHSRDKIIKFLNKNDLK